MRMLITGGAGCLGANIIDQYAPRGAEIVVMDNFATSTRAAIAHESVRIVEGSVADRRAVGDVFSAFGPDVVVHAAASYKDPDDWRGDLAVNALGTINVVEATRTTGRARLVYLQTALCYGRTEPGPIPVSAPLRPFTSYAGEYYALSSGLDAVSLRLANVTGPRLTIGPIPAFYSRLKAGKACFCSEAVRDFLDMEDFLCLFDRAIARGGPRGAFNVASGEGATIRDVFDVVAAHLGLSPPAPASAPVGADDVANLVLNPSETVAAFEWRPAFDWRRSVKRTLDWYDAHGVTPAPSHVRPPAEAV
jgi:UDP-glucose 4-epimerase